MIKKEQDGAIVILFKNDSRQEVFLVFRSDYPIWVLTGGGIENNETPEQAAVREALEESGFKIKIVRKLWVVKKPNGQTTHAFEGRRLSGEFKPEYPGCRGGWFNTNHLPFETLYKTRVRIKEATNFYGEPIAKHYLREPLVQNLPLIIRHPIAAAKFIWNKYLKSLAKL